MIKKLIKTIMEKKLILIIITAIIVSAVVVFQIFFKKDNQKIVLEKVSLGTVIREVSETGSVKVSQETDLSFKNAGVIEKIYVEVGDNVKMGQEMVKLDTKEISIQIQEAQASLEVARANYNKLLAGASQEEIKVSETKVLDAQASLDKVKQSLEDIKIDAEYDLKAAYEDAIDTLDDSYLKLYNTYNTADLIQRTYFTSNDQEGFKVKENRDIIKKDLDAVKFYIDAAKRTYLNKDIDLALSEIKKALLRAKDSLEIIRNMAETIAYQGTVSTSDKTSLDNQKSYINTAYTNVITVIQTISTTKITNNTNINGAEADVSGYEIKLQKTKDDLTLLTAGPRQEDIDLYQAQINQAKAEVSVLYNKIQEAVIKAPTDGQITKINKRKGEVALSAESVVSFLPLVPFQVKVDIYEEDVVNIAVGNPVEINLVAFPDESLKGVVSSVDPAEKLINGVVYYEVTIDFVEKKEGIKIGMTADIVIETGRKENVLVISRGAVKKINGQKIIQVYKNNKTEERKIEIGLEGNDLIEVVSGLKEGEEAVIK